MSEIKLQYRDIAINSKFEFNRIKYIKRSNIISEPLVISSDGITQRHFSGKEIVSVEILNPSDFSGDDDLLDYYMSIYDPS